MAKQVLSIGNCGFDNGSLRSLLGGTFGAEMSAADDWDDALLLLKRQKFDLVLVNRKLDAGGDGIEIIREMKQSPELQSVPVMLLSNYPEYQAQAVAAGAEPGFGKSQLRDPQTEERLKKHLA